ncbi:hypothetical protein PEC302107_01950 [Pectobacterium araliae]|uniref:Uncharacterized protein n=1 Tax=Pectobacterium araliae TaxID=3073862 RepID=A0AAN0KI07_9GAMM|nr:hypothetical protein PEC302110_01940 [Pectobacterium sp. MAFF 302110]GKW18466.1 hypothetical protein PEC302107_01950 [Pectobacterium carotovorum subsp. carotovorum]
MQEQFPKNDRICNISTVRFRKWDEVDVLFWKLSKNDPDRRSGEFYSNAYKDAYIQYNKELIIQTANFVGIPPELLGGVAWIEVGGKPEEYKPIIMNWREQFSFVPGIKPADHTSVGSVAMQIRVAARTLGLDPSALTTRDQLELSACLMEDEFNLRLVALHLRDVILYDYPEAASLHPTDIQYKMAGIRYNRGIERNKDDFVRYINANTQRGDPDWHYVSYGERLLQIRPHLHRLLGTYQ